MLRTIARALTNTGAVSYTEIVSGVFSAPVISDTIWVFKPSFVVPEVPLLGTAGAVIAMTIGLGVYLAKRK